jgi:hypothetical protein
VDEQLGIKIALLVSVAVIGILMMLPARGARHLALRRLGTLLLVTLAAVAIILPEIPQTIAEFVGVGRGADLLLYGLVIAFIASAVAARAERNRLMEQITELARAQAIAAASKPRDGE